MNLKHNRLGPEIKPVLCDTEGSGWASGLRCMTPLPGQALLCLWGSLQTQSARKQAIGAQSRISGKRRVSLLTPAISLLSEP